MSTIKKMAVITIMLLFAGVLSATAQTNKAKKMKPIQITKKEFLVRVADYEKNPNEWLYLGDKPAIIDFYATWCGPCKAVAPILDDLAAEYADKIVIYKVNTDAEQELSAAFGIRSIPSILFVPMTGKPVMMQGAMPKSEFVKAINNYLLNK